MANGFAGAQDAGDRRRRRLSQEEHDEQLFDEFFPEELVGNPVSIPFSDAFPASARLLRRFLSPRLWKHLSILMFVFAGVASIIWWDRSRASDLADAESGGLLVSAATGLLLLFCGQLAFVIGWIRSQSTLDFRGRYRWWKWLATAAVSAGLAILTGTHLLIPNVLATMVESATGPIQAARPTVVLVPSLLFCVAVFGRVIPDMSRNVWSQGILATALMVMAVRLMLIHTSSRAVVDDTTLNHMLLCSAWLSFSSLLLHCRFVAFVNNDPPAVAQKISDDAQPLQTDASTTLTVAETLMDNSIEGHSDDENTQPSTQSKQPTKKKASRRAGRKAA